MMTSRARLQPQILQKLKNEVARKFYYIIQYIFAIQDIIYMYLRIHYKNYFQNLQGVAHTKLMLLQSRNKCLESESKGIFCLFQIF